MDWYFERGSGQEGPVPGTLLQAMLGDGRLKPENKIWRKGLAEWQRASDVPEIQPTPASVATRSPAVPPPLPPPLETPRGPEQQDEPEQPEQPEERQEATPHEVGQPLSEPTPGAPTYVERPVDPSSRSRTAAGLASLEARFLGSLIDGFCYAPLFFLIAMGEEDSGLLAVGFAGVMSLVGYQAYLVTTSGQSIGKRAMKTKILKTDGGQVDFVSGVLIRTWLAFFIQLIPVLGSIFGLGDSLAIFFGESRQTLHDHMADTKVVNYRG
jgi:uncharacterized RDD family membrane protein YckC